ncbi:pancreatic triacylglycerol lipase-like [Bemisia tabaci]|uniref:pancreatic triacylglycerol lipase-like n=1 Tax=Bemisia tabaci TaxID=7038 RepID=UPI003B2884B3
MPDPVNIIVINWGRLCPQPCYTQSARNVALVGNCSALFIEALLQHQTWFTLKDIHFIGFSLGAQVMSQISHKLTIGKPYWITARLEIKSLNYNDLHLDRKFLYVLNFLLYFSALDPAWPLFDTMTTYAEERLDITDADFLDVYHTNAGYKGQLTSIGHVDFYANHALLQPGCGTNSSCNHVRAVYYYAESIYTKVGFYAYSCLSILTHLTGFCKPGPGDELVLLGAHVNHSTRGTYYFTTNDQYPFARGKVFDTQEEPIQAEHHMQSVEPVQPMQRPLPIDLRLSEIKASPKPSS